MASEKTNLNRDPKNTNRHPENGLATFIAILAFLALLVMAFGIF